ncbi:hypothetical protein YB2330_003200 [Saitoella coloradoensis]
MVILQPFSYILYIANRLYAYWSLCVNYTLYAILYYFLGGIPPSYTTRPNPSKGYRPSVFVTGADEGIGKAIAFDLANHGWTVWAGVLDDANGLKLEAEWGTHEDPQPERPVVGGGLYYIVCNVLDNDAIASVVKDMAALSSNRRDCPLTSVVNVAGFCMISPMEHTSRVDIQRMIDLDLMAYVDVTRAFLPLLKKHQGRVVNIGSYGGYMPVPGWVTYNAVKAGVENMTRAWSYETTKLGVRMTTVRPGWVRTEGIGPKIMEAMKEYEKSDTAIGFDSLGNAMEPDHPSVAAEANAYNSMMEKWKTQVEMQTRLGTPAVNVAKTVRDALSEAWMQPVYTVAYDALLSQMFRDFLPEPVMEWLTVKLFT